MKFQPANRVLPQQAKSSLFGYATDEASNWGQALPHIRQLGLLYVRADRGSMEVQMVRNLG